MSREIPYAPMHPPAKPSSSWEEMQRKLARRCVEEAQPLEPAIPTGPGTVIEWPASPEPGAYGVHSTCKRYSGAAITLLGKTSYELWKLVPGAHYRVLFRGITGWELLKRLAQADADRDSKCPSSAA